MRNALLPITYLGLAPFMINLGRALRDTQGMVPTWVAMTPAEAEIAKNNIASSELFVLGGLASDDQKQANAGPALEDESQYAQVYGFMKAKYGGSDAVWRARTDRLFRFLSRVIVQRKISVIVMWNGNDCVGKVCQILAARHGLETVFLENGYFSNTLQIDTQGINAEASVCHFPFEDLLNRAPLLSQSTTEAARVSAHPVKALGRVARAKLSLQRKLARNFFDVYPELLDQKHKKQVDHALSFTPVRDILARKRPFALVVLQVHDDTQVLLNSDLFKTPKTFLAHCHENVRRVFGSEYDIVVKLHPVDIHRYSYADMAAQHPDLMWVGTEPVEPLLEHCAYVMVINSSVGLQSIERHVPTMVFGRGFYSRDEVCMVVRELSDTALHLACLKAGAYALPAQQIDAFSAFLRTQYFVPGSWNIQEKANLAPVVQRVGALLSA